MTTAMAWWLTNYFCLSCFETSKINFYFDMYQWLHMLHQQWNFAKNTRVVVCFRTRISTNNLKTSLPFIHHGFNMLWPKSTSRSYQNKQTSPSPLNLYTFQKNNTALSDSGNRQISWYIFQSRFDPNPDLPQYEKGLRVLIRVYRSDHMLTKRRVKRAFTPVASVRSTSSVPSRSSTLVTLSLSRHAFYAHGFLNCGLTVEVASSSGPCSFRGWMNSPPKCAFLWDTDAESAMALHGDELPC